MKNPIKLSFIKDLEKSASAHWDLIQVVIGPRQVGKTTGVLQYLADHHMLENHHYASADGQIAQRGSWIEEQWIQLKNKAPQGLLVLDEIQKVENWSETIKKLWDAQKRQRQRIRVILLGSSSLDIQRGLSESLTGRFFLRQVPHWNFEESALGYNLSFEQFLVFGGYPGSYALIDDRAEWLSYLKNSIVDTVIGRDILQLARVKSPALFRQCFDLACSYGGQEISYTKMLGQLQDRGNVELVKHYLELFEGAFLLKQLPKFSQKKVLSRASSPKILPLCPALFAMIKDAELDDENRGRSFEIAVGSALSRLPGTLSYWRQKNDEVDYIYQFGRQLFAVEVKSGRKKSARGLSRFLELYPQAEGCIITPDNFAQILSAIARAAKH
jgi:predicted AAA+ superfamily ATPase